MMPGLGLRLHLKAPFTCCQTSFQTGLTTGCTISLTTGCQTGLTGQTGCKPAWQPVVSCKLGIRPNFWPWPWPRCWKRSVQTTPRPALSCLLLLLLTRILRILSTNVKRKTKFSFALGQAGNKPLSVWQTLQQSATKQRGLQAESCRLVHWNIVKSLASPLPSNRHHRSCGDHLQGNGKNYQVCSV